MLTFPRMPLGVAGACNLLERFCFISMCKSLQTRRRSTYEYEAKHCHVLTGHLLCLCLMNSLNIYTVLSFIHVSVFQTLMRHFNGHYCIDAKI